MGVSPRPLFVARSDFLSQNDRGRASHADEKDPGKLADRVHDAESGERISAGMGENGILRGDSQAPESLRKKDRRADFEQLDDESPVEAEKFFGSVPLSD